METLSKVCKKCGVKQPTANFSKGKYYADGLRPWCKACSSEYMKNYQVENRERLNAYHKQISNTEEYKARAVERANKWKKENPDKVKAAAAKYRDKYREELKVRRKERVQNILITNPDYYKDRNKVFREKDIERYRMYGRRSRKKGRLLITDGYVKSLFNKNTAKGGRIKDIPKELIEVKRLEVLIKRRVKDEERNNT